jgi:hypothetical protein
MAKEENNTKKIKKRSVRLLRSDDKKTKKYIYRYNGTLERVRSTIFAVEKR